MIPVLRSKHFIRLLVVVVGDGEWFIQPFCKMAVISFEMGWTVLNVIIIRLYVRTDLHASPRIFQVDVWIF